MADRPDPDAMFATLLTTLSERRRADPQISYTARLLAGGVAVCARKFGEEAVETLIAALGESDERVIEESADLIYHWMTMLLSRDIDPREVLACLAARAAATGSAPPGVDAADADEGI